MEQIYSMLGISAEVEAFGNAVLKDMIWQIMCWDIFRGMKRN